MALNSEEKVSIAWQFLEVKKNPPVYFLLHLTKDGIFANDETSTLKLIFNYEPNITFMKAASKLFQLVERKNGKMDFVLLSSEIAKENYPSYLSETFVTKEVFDNFKNLFISDSLTFLNDKKTFREAIPESSSFSQYLFSLPENLKNIVVNSKNLKIEISNNYQEADKFVFKDSKNNKISGLSEDRIKTSIKAGKINFFGQHDIFKYNIKTVIEVKSINDTQNISHELGHYFANLTSLLNEDYLTSDRDTFWKSATNVFLKDNAEHEITKRLEDSYHKSQYSSEMSAYMFEKYLPKFMEGKNETQAKQEMRDEFGHLFTAFEICYLDVLKKITVENIREYEGYKMPEKRIKMLEQQHNIKFRDSAKEAMIAKYEL